MPGKFSTPDSSSSDGESGDFDYEFIKRERKKEAGSISKRQNVYTLHGDWEDWADAFPDKLVERPWLAIQEHFENQLVNVGAKVFQYVSLSVLSPFAPKIVVAGSEERSALNIIIMANPGTGKTTCIRKGKYIAPYELNDMVQKQTQNALQDAVSQNSSGLNIFINDLDTIMGDSSLLKTYETVIADGFVKRDTANDSKEVEVRANMIAGAVPDDVDNKIYGGLIFRVVPIQIQPSEDQQIEIIDHVSGNVGQENDSGLSTEDISLYYDYIYDMMKGEFEGVPKITGYSIPDEHRQKIRNALVGSIKEIYGSTDNVSFVRQLHDGFRMMCLHALLNLPRRDIVEQHENSEGEMVGHVKIHEQDAKLAAALLKKQMGALSGFLSDDKIEDKFSKIEKYQGDEEFSVEGTKNDVFNL